jgi:hypothetical protein
MTKRPCHKVIHITQADAENAMAITQLKSPYMLHVYSCSEHGEDIAYHVGRKNSKNRKRGGRSMARKLSQQVNKKITCRLNLTGDYTDNSYHKGNMTIKHVGPDIEIKISVANTSAKLILLELPDAKLLHDTLGRAIYEATYFTGTAEEGPSQ